jgi:hypothetical protein
MPAIGSSFIRSFVSLDIDRFSIYFPPKMGLNRFQLKILLIFFPRTFTKLLLRKPWRCRPPEPRPTTTLHPAPSPYKHIGRLLLLSTFIGGRNGIFGAAVSPQTDD